MCDRTGIPLLALAALLAGGAWTPAEAQAGEASPGETRYQLIEVAGKPLPVQVEKEWRCNEEVVSGTLTMRGDGRWLLETVKRETCGDRVDEDRDSDNGMHRTEGGTTHFLDDDGRENDDDDRDDDIDLDELKTGTLGSDGSLTVQLADGRTTLLFRP